MTDIEIKQSALDALEKLNKEYAALENHGMDYVVTRVQSDNKSDANITHNFYFSISIPKPATETQQPG